MFFWGKAGKESVTVVHLADNEKWVTCFVMFDTAAALINQIAMAACMYTVTDAHLLVIASFKQVAQQVAKIKKLMC